jgi:hypothetical protein
MNRSIFNWLIQTWLALLLLLVSIPILADSSNALVETVNGAPMSDFYVLRDGKKLDVVPMKPLYEGDQLHILKPENNLLKDKQNYVTLVFGDKQLEKVTFENSPYLVTKRETVLTIPADVGQVINSWFNPLYQQHLEAVTTIPKKSEKKPFSIPQLTKSKMQLVTAGERSLHLAWQGGKAPYWVQVFSEHNTKEAFLIEHQVHTKHVQFEKRVFIPGYYRAIIISVDGSWRKTQADFKVVNNLPISLQKMETEMQASPLPELAKKTLFAAWLAQQEQGKWQFEAYQLAASIAKDYQPALLVTEGLEKTLEKTE